MTTLEDLEQMIRETAERIRLALKAKKPDSRTLTALSAVLRELRETMETLRTLPPITPGPTSGPEATVRQALERVKHMSDAELDAEHQRDLDPRTRPTFVGEIPGDDALESGEKPGAEA